MFSSVGWTGLGETIVKCPSTKPDGSASIDAMPASNKDTQAGTRKSGSDDIIANKLGGIDFHYPAQRLTQVYGNVSCQALRPCVAA